MQKTPISLKLEPMFPGTAIAKATIKKTCLPAALLLGLTTIVSAQKPVSYRGLARVNDRVLWVSGTQGTVMRTVNGGRTWKNVRVPQAPRRDFRDIHAFSKKTAFVQSSGPDTAEWYITHNGGKTWKPALPQGYGYRSGIFMDAIDFNAAGQGIAMGDPFADSGFFYLIGLNYTSKTQVLGLMPSFALRYPGFDPKTESAFAASGTCIIRDHGDNEKYYICSGNAAAGAGFWLVEQPRIFSHDYHWEIRCTRMPLFRGPWTGAYSMARAGDSLFVAVGGSFLDTNRSDSVGCWSADGGNTWNLCKGLRGYRSCVSWDPHSGCFYATGTNGTDYSCDGGKTWLPLENTGYNVLVIGKKYVWLAGDKGRLMRMRKVEMDPKQ